MIEHEISLIIAEDDEAGVAETQTDTHESRWLLAILGVLLLTLAVGRIVPWSTVTTETEDGRTVRVERKWEYVTRFVLGKEPYWQTRFYPGGVIIQGPLRDGKWKTTGEDSKRTFNYMKGTKESN